MGRATGIAGGFSQSLTVAYNRFATLPFLGVLIFLALYMRLNGASHFPAWDETYGQIIDVYIIMLVIFIVWSGKQTKWALKQPMETAAYSFGLFFIVTLAIMSVLVYSGFIGVDKTGCPYEIFWPTVIMQVAVISVAEEAMFRGVILEVTHSNIIQALAFSVFHCSAYGIVFYSVDWSATSTWIVPLIFAFSFGIILGIVARLKPYGGLSACVGIHSCYNLVIMSCLLL